MEASCPTCPFLWFTAMAMNWRVSKFLKTSVDTFPWDMMSRKPWVSHLCSKKRICWHRMIASSGCSLSFQQDKQEENIFIWSKLPENILNSCEILSFADTLHIRSIQSWSKDPWRVGPVPPCGPRSHSLLLSYWFLHRKYSKVERECRQGGCMLALKKTPLQQWLEPGQVVWPGGSLHIIDLAFVLAHCS